MLENSHSKALPFVLLNPSMFIKDDWHLSTRNLSLLLLPFCLEKAKRSLPVDNTSHLFYIKTYVSGIRFLEFTAQAHFEADLNIFCWISP